MRNKTTRFISLLLALVMVFSLTITGYAAERTPLLALHGDGKEPALGGRVTVCVDTTVDAVVADGKLTIRYDSQKLQFLSAKAGEAWRDDTDLSLQVNSSEAGRLVLAFAGEEPAMVGTVIDLSFQAVAEGASAVMVTEAGSYVTGAEHYTLEARTVVEVGGHNWSQWQVSKAATCTEPGEKTRTCTLCNEEETQAIPANGAHSWGEWKTIQEATCTTNGVQERECSLCHEKETKLILELGHSYAEEVVKPTCDQPGSKNIVCDDCGAIVTADIPIPPNGHQPGEWTVKTPSTCVNKGEEVKICSVCQQEVDSREIAATGIHTPSEWIIDTPQDCLNNGSKHKECTVCHTVLETEVIPSTGEHNFVGTVITPATCTTDGVISYTCNGCHTSHNEVIPKTGHQYKATVTQQATCVEDGIMTYECAVCGDSYTEPIPSDGSHDWGDWVNLTPSTCTEQGTRRHICNRCNEIEVEYLPLAAHNYSSEYTIDIQPTGTVKGEKSRHCLVCDARTDITDMGYCQHENTDGQWYIEREATCTLAGEKYQICSDCGDICNITEIPLLPHDYEQVGVLTPNTCTTDGVAQLRCTVCGDETTEALPAFGHTIGYWRVVTPATCSEAGKEERHCVTCDALMAERQIPAKGHGSFDWVVTLEPTCTENGSKAYTCGECGYVEKTETIAALGHSERFVSLVEPTCTTDGFRTYICDRCGYTHQSVAAATGHKAGKWTVQKTATTLGSGLKVKTCTVCGEVVASEVIPQLDSVNSAAVFKDVKAGSWYKPAVDFAVGSGLFTGTGTDTFSPNTVMTRGMLVTVLGRLSGVDASKYTTCYFEDVKSGSYYYGYIEWARQTGVVDGTDTYIFEPDRAITRQEICKIMVTYSKSRDIALKNFYPKKTFKDEAKIAGWAKAYVTSCQRAGIVSGDDKGYFHPTSSATRAEVATILMNYYTNFIK